MLVDLNEILRIAEEKQIAIGAFNTPNLTSAKAIIAAAEELDQPVIIMHAQIHETMGLCTVEDVGPMMLGFAKHARVPVCVHLDHGEDIDYVRRALELGFNSVMFDGSDLPEEENARLTKEVVALARQYGATVEAEIGSMGAREGGDQGNESIYTDPDTAAWFVKETGIDALSCAFGTVHGFYRAEPKLDFERLSKIRSLIDVPIVMHGGSGVSDADFREVIKRGVRKVNYYSYMSKAGGFAISNKQYNHFHDALLDAEKAIREDVKKAIAVFSNLAE